MKFLMNLFIKNNCLIMNFFMGNNIKILDIQPDILRLNRLIPDSDYEVIFLITPGK